jgi:hypothetical protein
MSEPARDRVGTFSTQVGWQAAIAGKPAPTGFMWILSFSEKLQSCY